MYKKLSWAVIGFISWSNIAFPYPSLSSSHNSIGPEAVYMRPLSPYDKRGGHICPEGKVFPEEFDSPSGTNYSVNSRDLFKDIINGYNVFKRSNILFAEIKASGEDGKIYDPKNESLLRRFGITSTLLISKRSTSYTKEELGLILEKYKFQKDFPETAYKSYDFRKRWNLIRFKNSAGKEISLQFHGPHRLSIISNGKIFTPKRKYQKFNASIRSCMKEGGLRYRSISVLNDDGSRPGKTLEYPTMILIFDILFYDTLNVKRNADIDF